MSTSPRLKKASQTTEQPQRPVTAPTVLLATALDTTWRAFLPTIGGVFLGIGIDKLFGIAPTGTVICLILGVVLSAYLITQQLRNVRKQR